MSPVRVPLVGLALLAAVVGSAPAAGSTRPIRHNQRFAGLVNGQQGSANVYVVCPGPATGRPGPPVGGQTVAVSRVDSGGGFTGSKGRRIEAQFVDDPSLTFTFTSYDEPQSIPSTLKLPCSGTGKVVFDPKPASPTAQPDTVTVTYVNIAV